ncbi:2-hydroxychromene-2-carboxylate isomerase [Notoacmeibacter sp. MSK16QG-6]|uniref:2-hydroxychromene-2-carboxylate isomerase n=1 Tax=Notoacmeibacter sp. MSK16QG-6 TaxID=2957982 RepID=UPI00209EAE5F|nr:2-hydroxychromene-2-carboxylate isomerase [Notoacmeibacter sp. MSK16QG-6]MCP1198622.1 2-hydroxychromene-2-carboxylate isomerase [Notoacmeibacter sp. MSK16QG-6]
MSVTVDYYFSSISPFSYLGHETLCAVADRMKVTLRYLPVDLGIVFPAAGAVPLAQRSDARKRYRLVELQRIAEMRDVSINPQPAHFPTDPSLADRVVIALVERDLEPRHFMLETFRALWIREQDIGNEDVVASILTACDLPSDELIGEARSEGVSQRRKEYSEQAVALGVLGVPTYVLNGELFFGQDRIEYLESALMTARAPYTGE